MRTRSRSFVFLTSVLAVAGLLAMTSVASAAPGAEGTGFSIRLHGGLSYLTATDVNAGAGGFFDYVQLLADAMGWTAEGGYSPAHSGLDFGGDIIFQLSRNIGVGLGAGYLRSTEESEMVLSNGIDATLIGTPVLSAIPIRLGVFFTLPLNKKINFTANAGAAYYAALKFDANLRIEEDPDWSEQGISASRNSLSGNLGFQGGLGFEYMFSPKMGFFVEALGRLAKFKNFATAHAHSEDSVGNAEDSDGVIYLETMTVPEGTWTEFIVAETPPTSFPPEIVYTEPKFDFSGFCIQFGIRIRL